MNVMWMCQDCFGFNIISATTNSFDIESENRIDNSNSSPCIEAPTKLIFCSDLQPNSSYRIADQARKMSLSILRKHRMKQQISKEQQLQQYRHTSNHKIPSRPYHRSQGPQQIQLRQSDHIKPTSSSQFLLDWRQNVFTNCHESTSTTPRKAKRSPLCNIHAHNNRQNVNNYPVEQLEQTQSSGLSESTATLSVDLLEKYQRAVKVANRWKITLEEASELIDNFDEQQSDHESTEPCDSSDGSHSGSVRSMSSCCSTDSRHSIQRCSHSDIDNDSDSESNLVLPPLITIRRKF